ncbi:CASP-like protein [Melia azedarach]|uniref:CASP-like protein n=1 Tax=Melia azedarach TaxID=155640 RepID=A0ACC1YEM4_MELAZ|nr:CASP-like protein [Melia azedarach]
MASEVAAPPKSEATPPPPPPPVRENYFAVDVALRVLLFSATLVSLVVMVSSKQTELVILPGVPIRVRVPAKFNHSPAFIYFVAAMAVACLYSIITTLASISVVLKPEYSKKFLLHFAFWDALILGIVASATGAAGGVAYIGLKGNSHTGWMKVCPVYDKFCRHLGSSIAISLLAAVLLVLLSLLSSYSLYLRIRD